MKALTPIVIRGNDPRLILEIIEYARDVFNREIAKRVGGIAKMYDGDSCSFSLSIDINPGALRLIAKKAGIKLPELDNEKD